MNKIVKVLLWGEEIGRLMWHAARHTTYFTYNPAFIRKGIEVSPLVAPIAQYGTMPVWGEQERIYQKLPAFIADSLPDAWGNMLFDYWQKQQHIANSDITALDKLSFIGKRGMGALEFVPSIEITPHRGNIEIKQLAEMAQRILQEREMAVIAPEEELTMQALIRVGTSAGGRQPKAVIAYNPQTGEIRSGQVEQSEAFEYQIIKFGDADYNTAEIEQTYYEMAIDAGVQMMPSRILTIQDERHFMTQRFDRRNGEKLHTQTLAAIYPEANSYEELMLVCRKLHLPHSTIEEIFRRMVFNCLTNNTDDHNKNFSFVMNQQGEWALSPAYDMTYILDRNGYAPNLDHCLSINGKLRNITLQDIETIAKQNGILKSAAIIEKIVQVVKHFREYAVRNGVRAEWIGRIETCIQQHLGAWGLEGLQMNLSYTIDGHHITDVHLEQAVRGNIHLYARIDGKEYKYIIRKKSAPWEQIIQVGICNLTTDYVQQLIETFLLIKQL